MTSLNLEAEYLMEHFEQDLPDVQSWCFWLLHDWRYIDFQTGHFADIEQFKINNYFADFKHVKTDPTYSFLLTLSKSKYFTEFRQDFRPLKSMQTLCLTKNSGTRHIRWLICAAEKNQFNAKKFHFCDEKNQLSVFLICGTK